jgi:diguanylate cyclase (GGDEF)-like protein
MIWNRFRQHSLKTRVTLDVLTIFLISIWSLSFYVGIQLQGDLQRQLSKQQFSTVSFLAADADRVLKGHLHSLGRLAGELGGTFLSDSGSLKELLNIRPVLLETFNAGVVAVNVEGGGLEIKEGESPLSYLDVDGVSTALREGKSTIGGASIDPLTGLPVFAISVPVNDERASVVGALVGIVSLTSRNFLDQITESYYGQSGYFLVVSEKDQRIVVGTGKRRIQEKMLPDTPNPLLERFAHGFDETGLTTDAKQEVLASARRIPVANWYLVAALPTPEAFSLVSSMQFSMFTAAIFLSLLAGGLTWWILRREFAPMLSAMKTLTRLSTSGEAPQPLPIDRPDEIGGLIGGFNRLLAALAARQHALRESENRFLAFMNTLPAAAFIESRDGKTIFANRYMTGTVGLHAWPARADAAADGRQAAIHEEEIRDAAGETRLFQTYTFEIPYAGHSPLVGGIALDITEHRRVEAQVRVQLLHDPLTGLPNRSLLNDRLAQALASARRSRCVGAVYFIDLDNFKPLNDRYGHATGDQLLIEAAARLKQCIREVDTAARFGGDEFVVVVARLAEGLDEAKTQALIVGSKLRFALSLSHLLHVNRGGADEKAIVHQCTASIGIALFDASEERPADVLKRADSAMYAAKMAGRNQLRFDAPSQGTIRPQQPEEHHKGRDPCSSE